MLRALLGFVGVLLVLAIVGTIGRPQLQSLASVPATTTRVHTPAAVPADAPSAQQQVLGVQQSMRERTVDALQQGVQRSDRAQP